MTVNCYEIGDVVRVTAAFTQGNSGTDPTAVVAKVKAPDGTVTTYTYGTDAALVRDSTGAYHLDVSASAAGTWTYRFVSTGNGAAADEGVFRVRPSAF